MKIPINHTNRVTFKKYFARLQENFKARQEKRMRKLSTPKT